MSADRATTPDAELDDASLGRVLARVQAGEREAVEALFERTSALVYGLSLRIVGDAEAAEEATAEVYLQVYREAPRWDPQRQSPLGWLLHLARARALNMARARAKVARPVTEGGLAGHERLSGVMVMPPDAPRVRAALAAMGPAQREALELAYFVGLGAEQIAAQTGSTADAVRELLRAALVALRKGA